MPRPDGGSRLSTRPLRNSHNFRHFKKHTHASSGLKRGRRKTRQCNPARSEHFCLELVWLSSQTVHARRTDKKKVRQVSTTTARGTSNCKLQDCRHAETQVLLNKNQNKPNGRLTLWPHAPGESLQTNVSSDTRDGCQHVSKSPHVVGIQSVHQQPRRTYPCPLSEMSRRKRCRKLHLENKIPKTVLTSDVYRPPRSWINASQAFNITRRE